MQYINETNNLPVVGNNVLFGTEDYNLLKHWQNTIPMKMNGVEAGPDSPEYAFYNGAATMLDDVLGMMEWPTNETIDAAMNPTKAVVKAGKAAVKHGVKAPVPEFHLSTNKVLVGVAVGIVVVAVWKDRKKAKQEAARRQAVRIVRPDREQQD